MLKNAILVTGAGSRIGYHIAKRLHEDDQSVIAHYRAHTDQIQALADLGVKIIQADFANSSAILEFVQALKSQCTKLRGVIHNASSFEPTSASLEEAAQQYERFFYIHMMAPFLINQGLQSIIKGEGDDPADIIHITDINVENPTPRFDIYGTTKAGLHNMTLVLAKKYAPAIKVNAVAPGPILFTKQHCAETQKRILQETPLAKEGGAESVYLAVKSVLDNPFITGISLPVDGGRRLSKR